jgi:AcrR family transcriptional regulator
MPVPKGATLDPARTRAQIIERAGPLLYARGIDGIGVAECCSALGISKMTLYRHFGSKDGLVEAVLTERSARVHRWLRSAADGADPAPADRLDAVFAALGSWYQEEAFRGCAVVNAATQSRGQHTLTIAAAHLDRYVDLFREIAADAGAPDPDALARRLLQVLEGATIVAAMDPDRARQTGQDAGATARLVFDQLTRDAVGP